MIHNSEIYYTDIPVSTHLHAYYLLKNFTSFIASPHLSSYFSGLFLVVCSAIVVYVYSQGLEVTCPPSLNGELILLRHPCNCSSYYVCFGDLLMSMPCPPNLHFNDTVKACDWPSSAKCTPKLGCPQSQLNDEEITP